MLEEIETNVTSWFLQSSHVYIDTGALFHSRMIKKQFEKLPSSHDHACKIFYINFFFFFGYVLIFTDCRNSLKAYAKQTVTHVRTFTEPSLMEVNRKMSHYPLVT